MIRLLWAVCAANLAAPFIFLTVLAAYEFPSSPLEGLKALAGVALVGVLALPQLFPFALPASLLLSVVGRVAGWRARWTFVAGGAVIGVVFLTVFSGDALDAYGETASFIPISIVTGAICGWIYWRIAIGRTPANSHAIDAA